MCSELVTYNGQAVDLEEGLDDAALAALASLNGIELARSVGVLIGLLEARGASVYCHNCTADLAVSIIDGSWDPAAAGPLDEPPDDDDDDEDDDGEAEGHPRTESAPDGTLSGQTSSDDKPGDQPEMAPPDERVLGVRGRTARSRCSLH